MGQKEVKEGSDGGLGLTGPDRPRPGSDRPRPGAVPHLHVFGDEDFASFLDHGLRLQLLGGELAFPGVKHFLSRDAGQRQVRRVGLVAQGDLDGLGVDGTGGVPS